MNCLFIWAFFSFCEIWELGIWKFVKTCDEQFNLVDVFVVNDGGRVDDLKRNNFRIDWLIKIEIIYQFIVH